MEKLFYTIGEAAQIIGVKPYVLRYWEGEFRKLNPQKSETGQRTYRNKDLQMALAIKNLLYEDKYTIAGAVKKLEEIEADGFPPLVLAPSDPSPQLDGDPVKNLEADKGPRVQEKGVLGKFSEEFLDILERSFRILERNGLGGPKT